MSLDDRISQLVRDALAPMLAERLEHLEESLVERLLSVVQSKAESTPSLPPLLGLKEVAGYLAVSPRTLERMVSAGEFPPPIPISPGRARWRQSDVDAWLDSRRAS